MNIELRSLFAVIPAAAMFAQPGQAGAARPTSEAQAQSAIRYSASGPVRTIELVNAVYEVAGPRIPGRPKDERLVLRETTRTKEVLDEKGMEASTVIEAWVLGADLKQKPLYSMTIAGVGPKVANRELVIVSRGLEDVAWWSVYKLGSGQHLLDTYVPLVHFEAGEQSRYAGLEVPPDNSKDKRLTASNVVAVLTYAAPDHVIREALITCSDSDRARLLRSYFDASRTMEFSGGALRISIRPNPPSPAGAVTIVVPVNAGDLGIAKAQMPAGIRIEARKR